MIMDVDIKIGVICQVMQPPVRVAAFFACVMREVSETRWGVIAVGGGSRGGTYGCEKIKRKCKLGDFQ